MSWIGRASSKRRRGRRKPQMPVPSSPKKEVGKGPHGLADIDAEGQRTTRRFSDEAARWHWHTTHPKPATGRRLFLKERQS